MPFQPEGDCSVYYFAYGSNLSWPQMRQRCPSSRFVCAARLDNYQFGITRHSRLRDCGTANVVPVKGQQVWGAVYDVSDGDLIVMDGFEDGYRREILSVEPIGSNRPPFAVLVYVAEIEIHVPLPSAEYKRLILQGAKHWQLPASYLAMLEAIDAARET
jgi:gamma-glutamylcyclotransferase